MPCTIIQEKHTYTCNNRNKFTNKSSSVLDIRRVWFDLKSQNVLLSNYKDTRSNFKLYPLKMHYNKHTVTITATNSPTIIFNLRYKACEI
ncbi:hypothetical protein Hanom_Chr12g01133381 [Helianthus anomalus]